MMFRFRRPPPRALASPRAGSWFFAAALLAAVVAVLIPPASLAADFTPDQRKAIESIIHDYLTKNPDVLLEALQAAEDKMKGDAKDKAAQALSTRRREIFEDPDTPVAGNPNGDVSLVEFFDYRCPYCKQVEPSLEALLGEDRQLRLVYKEFPVLGPESVTASKAALAARKQGKYDAFHRAMMTIKGQINDTAVYKTDDSVGFAFENIAEEIARDEISDSLAMRDRLAQPREAGLFEAQITFEDLAHILADQELVEVLQIGQAVEEQDALDQLVGVLHLVERGVVLAVAELCDAPMAQHPRMQKILIDRGQLVLEHRIQMLDDGLVAPHCRPPQGSGRSLNWKANARGRKAINPRRPSFLLIQPPLGAFGGQRARTCRIAAGSRRRGTPSRPSSPRQRYGDEDRGRSMHCTGIHT